MTKIFDGTRARIAHSPLIRRFFAGATWSVIAAVASGSISLTTMIFVARLLGKQTYGQFVVIQSTLGMVGVFAGFGIGAVATRYAAELKQRGSERLGNILGLAERTILVFGLLASMGLMLSAGWTATHILNATDLTKPLAISSGAVLFAALDGYQKSVLIGFESMRAYAIGTIIGITAGFPVMLLAANYYGLEGAAVAMVINTLLQAGISRYQMLKQLQKYNVQSSASGCLNEWPVLLQFALPALLAGALVSPSHWAAQAFLANTPNGYTELAVLGVAMQWFNVILFVPSTAGRVIAPILTDYVTKNDNGSARKILLCAMGANAVAVVPLATIVGALSPYIMSLYGKSFEYASAPLVVAVATASLLAILAPVGNLLAALSRMWLGALMNAGWAVVYVGLAYLLVGNGALGITIALGIGYVFHATWTLWFAQRQVFLTIKR